MRTEKCVGTEAVVQPGYLSLEFAVRISNMHCTRKAGKKKF